MTARRFIALLALVVGLSSALLLPGCVHFDGAVDFEADVLEGKKPLTIQFTLLAQGCVDSCLWSFGDDTFSRDRNPAHTYEQAGDYTVIVTVFPCRGEPVSARKDDYITVTSGFGSAPPRMWCYYGDNERNRIWRSELVPPFEGQNSGGNEVLSQAIGVPHDFALVGRWLFWTDQAARKIFATDVTPGGSDEVLTVVTCADVPYGLVVDPASLDVYWSEDDPDIENCGWCDDPPYIFRIMRVGFDGSTGHANTAPEWCGKSISPIEDLAFDGVDRVLYHASYRVPAYEMGVSGTSAVPQKYSQYCIDTVQVDGGSDSFFYFEDGPITELAVDQVGRKLYWFNAAANAIRRVSIGEYSAETVLSDVPGVADLAIDEQNRRIVWVSHVDGIAIIGSAALDGSDVRYRLRNAMTAQYTAIAIGPRPPWSPDDLAD
jgi:PKD repeat protein